MEYTDFILLALLVLFIFFVLFFTPKECFSMNVNLKNFGPCDEKDTQGNCIERKDINELNGIELKTIKNRIENAVNIVDKFKTDSAEALSNFDNSVKNKMTSCFGTKDTAVCKDFNNPTCRTYGTKPCIRQGQCTSYHRIPYGCNWGCTRSESYCSRRNWRGSCTDRDDRCVRYGHRSTCYRNGACKSYACAEYGNAPCTSWNSPTCKNYDQEASFTC